MILVDGEEGTVSIEPTPELLRQAMTGSGGHRRAVPAPQDPPRLRSEAPRAALKTADGVEVCIEANVDLLGDASFARAQGAEGIGLFRSELLLAGRPADELTEDLQYDVYRQLLEDMRPAPVTVRTFDIDEDQLASGEQRRNALWGSGYEVPRSRLGLRSIRLTLKRRELLRTQLRALVRAARHGDLARHVSLRVGHRRAARGAERAGRGPSGESGPAERRRVRLRVGVMIEVPSAALTADILARRVGLSDHRHERPDPMLPRRGPYGRTRVASVRAAASGDPPADSPRPARRGKRMRAAVGVR